LLGDASVADLVACSAWPVADLGDAFRETFSSSVPTLVISGTLDSHTPPEVAEAALASFSDWRHVIIEGGSHDDDLLLSSPKIADLMLAFLKGEEVGSQRIILPPLRFGVP
jgi:pimeloyl-ACP methyl ester carboxylesterase